MGDAQRMRHGMPFTCHVHCGVTFYAGGVPHGASVRHIFHGDAFKVGGLANVVLLVSIRNIDLQSLGLIYGYGKS